MTTQPFVAPSQSAWITNNEGRVIGHMSLGGPDLQMPVGDKIVLFEMHNYFGPIPTSRRTGDSLERIPRGFWDAYERWELGGKLVDGNLCVVPDWCSECGGKGYDAKSIEKRMRNEIVCGDCPACQGRRVV